MARRIGQCPLIVFMNTKKILIILLIVVIVGAIAVGAYFGYKSSSSIITSVQKSVELPVGGNQGAAQTSQTSQQGVGSGISNATSTYDQQRQNLSLLTNSSPVDYWIASSTSTSTTTSTLLSSRVFYIDSKGEVVEITGPLQERVISASNYGAPQKIVQSIDGQKAAIEFESGEVAIFDVKTSVWRDLGSGISSFDFSPDGTKLAVLKYSGGSANIYVLNLLSSKSSLSLLSNINILDTDISWPDKNKIFLMPKQSYNSTGQIWYLDINKKTVNLLAEGQGIDAVFSYPFDYTIEFVSSDQSHYSTSLVNKSGVKSASMSLNTLPEKCSFSYDHKQIYCAVSYENNKGSGLVLPDDYLMGAVYFHDWIYKIDVDTLKVSLLLNLPDKMIDASNLKEVKNQLFFINRLDGQLYVLNING